MSQTMKLALGLIVNLLIIGFVGYRIQMVELDLLTYFQSHAVPILAASVLLVISQIFAALRLHHQLIVQSVDVDRPTIFKLTYFTFFITQVFNFTGVQELIRYLFIKGQRGAVIKALLADKVVDYTAKITLVVGLLYPPAFLVFGLLGYFRQYTLATIYALISFACFCGAFSLVVFGHLQGSVIGGQTLLLTSLMPTLNDWGSRELVSSTLSASDMIIQGSIVYGIVVLLASAPGIAIYFQSPELRELTFNDILIKLRLKKDPVVEPELASA